VFSRSQIIGPLHAEDTWENKSLGCEFRQRMRLLSPECAKIRITDAAVSVVMGDALMASGSLACDGLPS
jgi:hypothetical protein